MIRSLWIHYPDDPAAVARGDEYLFGRDILVAPVVEKGADSRTLYLPRGAWYDFWTQEKLEGGREITRHVDLKTMPLYVRAGAVLPMGPVKQYSDEKADGPLTLSIHPGANGVFSLYEDDGKTFNYRKGQYMQVEIAWRDRDRQLSLRLAKKSKMLEPIPRTMRVKVVGETTSRDIQFEGRPITVKC